MTPVEITMSILLLLLLFPCILKKNRGYKETVSITTTRCFKGILCILIIFFHTPASIRGGTALSVIHDTGFLIVGAFFLLSGYGLFSELLLKREEYLQNFLRKRIVPLIGPWALASILYALMFFLIGGKDLFIESIWVRENGYLIVSHSWYVVVQILFYLLFYCAEKFIIRVCADKMVCWSIISAYTYTIALIAAMSMLKLGTWWYYSLLAFPTGIALKAYEKKEGRTKQRDAMVVVVSLLLFFLFYAIRYYNGKTVDSYVVWVLCKLMASSAFAALMLSISYFVRFDNPVLCFLAKLSYNIYLIHMLFYTILRSDFLYIEIDFLYFAITIILSVLYSFAASFCIRRCKSVKKFGLR